MKIIQSMVSDNHIIRLATSNKGYLDIFFNVSTLSNALPKSSLFEDELLLDIKNTFEWMMLKYY